MAVKNLWLLTVAALLFAAHPIAVAYLGIQLNNDAMKTYHWMAIIFTPLGLVIGFVTGLAAIVMQLSQRSRRKLTGSS